MAGPASGRYTFILFHFRLQLSNVIHRTSLVRSGYHGGHHVIDHGHIGRPIVHSGLMGGYFGVQYSGSHDFGSGHVAGPVIHAHHLPIVHHVHHVVSPVVYPHHHFGHVVVARHHRHHHRRHRKKKGSSSGSSSNSS